MNWEKCVTSRFARLEREIYAFVVYWRWPNLVSRLNIFVYKIYTQSMCPNLFVQLLLMDNYDIFSK